MSKLPSHLLADNRAARFHYEILETFEAGIVLTGRETKSARTSRPHLKGAFISVDSAGEAWLKSLNISPYKYAKGQPHEARRDRKLLLSKSELKKISNSLAGKGISAFPLDLHLKNGKIKVLLGLGRGKKKWDKREVIKKRDLARENRRKLK